MSLNYGRIQDIHLTSNVVERWLGLGKIQVQTASASAKAELTVEGVPDLDALRDFLYARMRGARDEPGVGRAGGGLACGSQGELLPAGDVVGSDELADTLRAVAMEIRALRTELAAREGDRA